MASGREVSLSLRLWFVAKIQAGGILDSAVRYLKIFAYDACQHCPHLWIQDRILGNLYFK